MLKSFHENFVKEEEYQSVHDKLLNKQHIKLVEHMIGKSIPLKSDFPLNVLVEELDKEASVIDKVDLVGQLIQQRLAEKKINLGKGIEYNINCDLIDFRPHKFEQKI